ncbi:MAG: ABC transporter substrate-binding protein [Elusimicrobiota bacterium]
MTNGKIAGFIVMAGVLLLNSSLLFAAVKNPGTLVYAMTSEPESLDPDWEFDAISHEVTSQIYETLIAYEGWSVKKFVPRLASVVPSSSNGLISGDGLRYAFPIRGGVRFQNGAALTAKDVKYSLLRCMFTDRAAGPSFLLLEPILGVSSIANKNGTPNLDLYDEADRAVSVEAGALVIYLNRPYPALMSILAGYCPIVSKSWIVAHGGWDGTKKTIPQYYNPQRESATLFDHGDGTGPFRLVRWDRQNKEIILARNEQYWKTPASLKNVVFKAVDDFQTRKLMLSAGDADAITVDRTQIPQLSGMAGVSIVDNLPMLEVHDVFIMNFHVNPEANPFIGSGRLDGEGIPPNFFSDANVRRGMAYSFDNSSYIRDGYQGHAIPSRGPIPSNVFGYNPDQPLIPYDPVRAERYFKKAFGGEVWSKGFRFTLTYQLGFQDRLIACEILKKNIEALNPKFRIDIMGMEWPAWLSAHSSGRIPMTNARWLMDYPDADDAVRPFLWSQGYYAKIQGYSNPQADRDIAQAVYEQDRRRRKALYYDLQAIAYSDVPQIYTVESYYTQVTRSWVHHWSYNSITLYGYLYPVTKSDN